MQKLDQNMLMQNFKIYLLPVESMLAINAEHGFHNIKYKSLFVYQLYSLRLAQQQSSLDKYMQLSDLVGYQ